MYMPRSILDTPKKIEKLDSQGMLGSIESLALQCQQAWDDTKAIRPPASYRKVDRILLNGMGGSALGGDVVQHLFQDRLRVPFSVTNQYRLPSWANSRTLCILSSYSGTTEEVLASFRDARRHRAKIVIICAGGTLARLAKRYRLPVYQFEPRFNPSNQPRMALGYSVVGIASLLIRTGHLRITDKEFTAVINHIVRLHKRFGVGVPTRRNPAKQVSKLMHGHMPIIIAANHLSGNAHIAANQINENGKNFAAYFLLSELNHHLMEGLSFPKQSTRQLAFLFLESSFYHPRNQRRLPITQRVAKRKAITIARYRLIGSSLLSQVFEALSFSSYVSFYLAMLNNIDPSPIPVVDYFKAQLKK